MIIRLMGLNTGAESSSFRSLGRGKPTEVDYYKRYNRKKGIEMGIDTPINKSIVQMIKEIESGKRKIEARNFFDRG